MTASGKMETSSNIHKIQRKLPRFPFLGILLSCAEAASDTADLRRLKGGNQTAQYKTERCNSSRSGVFLLYFVRHTLWAQTLLSNAPTLYAIFIDNHIIKAATIQLFCTVGRCGKLFGFLPYRKLLRFPRPEEKATIFIALLFKKVNYILGKRKLSFKKSLISRFPSQELSLGGL